MKLANTFSKWRKYLPLAIIPLVLGVVLALWSNLVGGNLVNVAMTQVNGEWVFDLREADFENNFYRLHGEVPMVSHVSTIPFVNPDNFDDYENYHVNAPRPGRSGWNTSRLRILLPEDEWVSFSRVSIGHSMRLYVNGRWMLDVGQPATTVEQEVAHQSRISFTALPENGVLELVQQSSSFVHFRGGGHYNWYIGNHRLQSAIRNVDYIQNIILGIFLALFLIYALMYFLLKGDTKGETGFKLQSTNLYFAIFCLAWFFRLGSVGSHVMSDIFPDVSWVMQYKSELLAMPVAAWTVIAIINVLFPNILHKLFRITVYTGSAIIVLLILLLDTYTLGRNLQFIYFFYGPAIIYLVVRGVWKIRKVNLAQGIFMAGCGFFLYTSMREMIHRTYGFLLPPFNVAGMVYYEMAIAVTTNMTVLIFAFCMAAAIFISTKEEVEAAIKARERLVADNASLIRLDKMRADLIANVTHETLTPLSVLSVYSELVARELRSKDIDEQAARDLESISDEAIHIASLLDGLNNNTDASENRLAKTALDLPDLVKTTVRLYMLIVKRTGSSLETKIESDLPKVYACAGEITQVLFNLIQNAHKHTVEGTIVVKISSEDDFVKVTVTDTGFGIPPDLLPHVFERGVSGNDANDANGKPGTGLGLALCKEIIEAHNGTIEINSKYGEGTNVWFTLPIWKQTARRMIDETRENHAY